MQATAQQASSPDFLLSPSFRSEPLYVAAAISAFSGIAYELLLATYATFLMGASIFQYSLVLSLMMASMGVGSLLADRTGSNPFVAFLATECLISLVAVIALPALYFAHAKGLFPRFLLVSFVLLMGGAIGMEIPLLNRIPGVGDRLSRLLFADYLGGFVGGVVFPLVLVPHMSLFQIGGLLALVNSVVALGFSVGFRRGVGRRAPAWIGVSLLLIGLSAAAFRGAEPLRLAMEHSLFGIEYHP